MAGARRAKSAPTEHGLRTLTYGHFGSATYDEHDHTWKFLRNPASGQLSDIHLDENGGNKTVSSLQWREPPEHDLSEGLPFGKNAKYNNQSQQIRRLQPLFDQLPQIAPALRESRVLSPLSLSEHTWSHRSFYRRHLCFGSAAIIRDNGKSSGQHNVPIVAFISQANPLILNFACVQRRSVSVGGAGQKSIPVEAPSVLNATSIHWTSTHGLLETVRSAWRGPKHTEPTVAVLSTSAITIFRPIVADHDIRDSTPMAVNPNPVLTIPSSATGSSPLCDFAFNPTSTQQLAVVDTQGSWSVWRLRFKQSKSARISHRAELAFSGYFPSSKEAGHASENDYDAGWYRLSWFSSTRGEIDRLIVCSRTQIVVFDLHGIVQGQIDIRSGPQKEHHAMVDICTPLKRTDQCIVLTTSKLLWFAVGTAPLLKTSRKLQEDRCLDLLGSWNHFRSQTDFTLSLSMVETVNDCFVCVCSLENPLLLLYHCVVRTNQHGEDFSVHDPVPLQIPVQVLADTISISVQTTQLTQLTPNAFGNPRAFIMVFRLNIDDRISETLYELLLDHMKQDNEIIFQPTLPLPSKRIRYYKSARHVESNIQEEDNLEDFILFDEAMETMKPEIPATSTCAWTNHKLPGSEFVASIVNMSSTYEKLLTSILGHDSQRVEFDHWLEQMKNGLQRMILHKNLKRLLSEVSHAQPVISELEENSQSLSQMLQSFSHSGGQTPINPLVASYPQTLLEVYESIVVEWMNHLPQTVPNRIRIQRERLCREVALDLVVANTALHQLCQLPAAANGGIPSSEAEHAFVSNAPNTITTDDHGTESLSQPENEVPPAVAFPFLYRYTTLKKAVPKMLPLPSSVDRILAHFPVTCDVDPKSYSWRDSELQATISKQDESETLSDSKAQRKARRLVKQREQALQKQAESRITAFEGASRVPAVFSSPLPIRDAASSRFGLPLSSQPTDNMPTISMTQPEAGIHGTRSTNKPKNKVKGKVVRSKGF